MKRWDMIHKIKAMFDQGNGSSIKEISRSLGVSKNTVRKYIRMDEQEIQEAQELPQRTKSLDKYRGYLISLLNRYPALKTPKVLRRLKAKVPEVAISERSLRRYLSRLKKVVISAQPRYYEPIIDEVPGVQCQVDPGELRNVDVGGVLKTLYFVVFVLSYSRLMYVGLSLKPINTGIFIQMHDAAFRFFGGVPEECVYDQTKLVVIEEVYREVTFNERFNRYATQAGISPWVCEGYDPESKGKVEAGVKYVKQDCLYGEQFRDWQALQCHVQDWLNDVANTRIHGTTKEVPRVVFDARERQHLTPYSSVTLTVPSAQRKVDKTGLISWQGNKYSVPMAYQRSSVGVDTLDNQLIILDPGNDEEVARHTVVTGKGHIVKNTDHYRDQTKRISDHEAGLERMLGEAYGRQLCAVIKQTSPRIYRDQLAGVISILSPYPDIEPSIIERLIERPRLTATQVRDYLDAYARNPDRFAKEDAEEFTPGDPALLNQYAGLCSKTEGASL